MTYVNDESGNIRAYLQQVAATKITIANEKLRPFMLLRPHIFIDGDKWCALYGDNLQDGVCGLGQSPDEASRSFDESWFKKLPE